MAQDESQIKAIALSQEGEYEEAIETMAKSESVGNEEFKKFVEQCKSCLADQYTYLITEAINEGDYDTATNYKEEFIEKFGSNPQIANIEIKRPVIKEEIEKSQSSQVTGNYTCNVGNPDSLKDTPDASSTRYSNKLIMAVVGIAVIILIFVLSRSCDGKSQNDSIDYPACDTTSVDPFFAEVMATETSSHISSTPSDTENNPVESVPDYSGEWEPVSDDFSLNLFIEQDSYSNNISATGVIYRLCDWELKGRIENGKLILDDG